MSTYIQDPNAILDYKFDWKPKTNGNGFTDWLTSAETITAITITASAGITVDSSSITDSSSTVTVWLSGGTDGTSYTIACKIVTSAGRTDERTITVAVANQ